MKTLIFSFFTLISVLCYGETVRVGLKYYEGSTSAVIRISNGSYELQAGKNVILDVTGAKHAEIHHGTNGLKIKLDGKTYGPYEQIKFRVKEWNSEFQLRSIVPRKEQRVYQDNLIIRNKKSSLLFINEVEQEKYVSGTVEAESGSKAHPEYYKVQSIISRTYMLSNERRHILEGYNVCDQVHCQVYHGKSRFSDAIPEATWATKGQVLVDSDINLITAAFHSNCGGHTIAAEQVWSKPLPYLVGIRDTFCLHQPHSHWERSIPRKSWLNYLDRKHELPLTDSTSMSDALAYFPGEKSDYFDAGDLKIPFKDIRFDWKLRSAFFSIYEEKDHVRLTGKGFGHGVGLCQEGAMKMADLNYSFMDIIHHYYTGVHLVHLSVISFFRDDRE